MFVLIISLIIGFFQSRDIQFDKKFTYTETFAFNQTLLLQMEAKDKYDSPMCSIEQRYVELQLQEYQNIEKDIIDSTVYNNQLLTMTSNGSMLEFQTNSKITSFQPFDIKQKFSLLYVETQAVLLVFSNTEMWSYQGQIWNQEKQWKNKNFTSFYLENNRLFVSTQENGIDIYDISTNFSQSYELFFVKYFDNLLDNIKGLTDSTNSTINIIQSKIVKNYIFMMDKNKGVYKFDFDNSEKKQSFYLKNFVSYEQANGTQFDVKDDLNGQILIAHFDRGDDFYFQYQISEIYYSNLNNTAMVINDLFDNFEALNIIIMDSFYIYANSYVQYVIYHSIPQDQIHKIQMEDQQYSTLYNMKNLKKIIYHKNKIDLVCLISQKEYKTLEIKKIDAELYCQVQNGKSRDDLILSQTTKNQSLCSLTNVKSIVDPYFSCIFYEQLNVKSFSGLSEDDQKEIALFIILILFIVLVPTITLVCYCFRKVQNRLRDLKQQYDQVNEIKQKYENLGEISYLSQKVTNQESNSFQNTQDNQSVFQIEIEPEKQSEIS